MNDWSSNRLASARDKLLTRSRPGLGGYIGVGITAGAMVPIILAILTLYVVVIALFDSFMAPNYGHIAAILLGITLGAVVTGLAVVFSGVETVGIGLAIAGAIIGFFDAIVAWIVGLIVEQADPHGSGTAVIAVTTAIVCGPAAVVFGWPFIASAYNSGPLQVVAITAVINALIGGMVGLSSD